MGLTRRCFSLDRKIVTERYFRKAGKFLKVLGPDCGDFVFPWINNKSTDLNMLQLGKEVGVLDESVPLVVIHAAACQVEKRYLVPVVLDKLVHVNVVPLVFSISK